MTFGLPNSGTIDKRFLERANVAGVFSNREMQSVDEFLMDNGVLLDDIALLKPEEVQWCGEVSQLRHLLYGDNTLPIVRRQLSPVRSELTDIRRQLAIERLIVSRAIVEYRMFTESMASRGQWGNVQDDRIRATWSSWVSSLSRRLSEALGEYHASGTTDQVNYKYSGSAKRAMDLISTSGVNPEALATLTLVTATSEMCNPDSSRSTVTGRGNSSVDFDAMAGEVRRWTNTDLESSMTSPGEAGRALFSAVCDVVGSALAFEANAKRSRKAIPVHWSQEERMIVGSELLRLMLAECMVKVDARAALAELQPETNCATPDGKFIIDPEVDLFYQRAEAAKVAGGVGENESVLVNAFVHAVESRGFKSTGYLSVRPSLIDSLARVMPRSSFFRLPPMVTKPAPWLSFWQCGYVTRRFPLIRFTGTKDGARDAQTFNLDRVRESMDYLASTPWRVNLKVLELVETALRMRARSIPGIPSHGAATSPGGAVSPSSEKISRRVDLIQRLKEKQKKESEEPIFLSKLSVARTFKDAPEIFFPHSIDFRGRAYPIPAPFNHQGDDFTRSLLLFGEKKRLGNRGWFWLRLHCANLFGKDKLSFDQRIAWVSDNWEAILCVGQDALSPESVVFVTAHTEDFWQAVACCIEIHDAVTACGPEPIEFCSSLPVQQDGSCNGLQHYAALGRDRLGALAVNVAPSDKVEDVYSVVLALVKQRVQEDAQRVSQGKPGGGVGGITFAGLKANDAKTKAVLARLALESEGVLQRRTVKQTVMTICYGVTQIGASDQVQKQLSDLPIAKTLNATQLAVLSSYLARLTLSSIDTVFNQAMEIKRWFDLVSAEVNKHKLSVSWISPAGVPCRQPYRQPTVTEIRTPLQKITIMSDQDYDTAPVSGAKQRMGFPPNFIHSLDASHMILTSLKCKEAGIAFAAVHDSFWTHAADVDVMNSHIRQEFFAMYQQPILERLRASIVLQLGAEGKHVPPLPKQGDLDLKCVLNSPYFFH